MDWLINDVFCRCKLLIIKCFEHYYLFMTNQCMVYEQTTIKTQFLWLENVSIKTRSQNNSFLIERIQSMNEFKHV